jgi:hypothetical protein
VADEVEALVIEQVFDIAPGPGEEIVEAGDFRTLRQQAFAQMRAEEPGATGH